MTQSNGHVHFVYLQLLSGKSSIKEDLENKPPDHHHHDHPHPQTNGPTLPPHHHISSHDTLSEVSLPYINTTLSYSQLSNTDAVFFTF